MGLRFTKMAGCGNDFLLVESAEIATGSDLSRLGARLCDRQRGIGADGLIVLQPPVEGADYRVTIINATGLPAEMCGNGARCVARYAVEHGLAPAHHTFATVAGLIRAEVDGATVSVQLTEPHSLRLDLAVESEGVAYRVDSIDTGVPHAVIWLDDVAPVEVERLGRPLRYHAAFAPRGTNVNFAQVSGGGLVLRTYERGVEAETLACGTGSAAAAILGWRRGLVRPPVRVRTREGAHLTIDFAPAEPIRDVRLIGPTTTICRGEVSDEIID